MSSSTNQTPTPGGVWWWWWRCGGFFYFLLHLPVSPYFSLSTSLTTRHPVFGTAALIFLRGRQRILKATITAENYQFPFPLTLWEERGQGRGHETRKGDERFKFGMKSHPPPPHILPQGCTHVFWPRRGGGDYTSSG